MRQNIPTAQRVCFSDQVHISLMPSHSSTMHYGNALNYFPLLHVLFCYKKHTYTVFKLSLCDLDTCPHTHTQDIHTHAAGNMLAPVTGQRVCVCVCVIACHSKRPVVCVGLGSGVCVFFLWKGKACPSLSLFAGRIKQHEIFYLSSSETIVWPQRKLNIQMKQTSTIRDKFNLHIVMQVWPCVSLVCKHVAS